MKLSAFEKIIRKVVREEIDYALRREIALLKEELSFPNPQQSQIQEATNSPDIEDFRSRLKSQVAPNFNTGNGTLDSLLSETATAPTPEEKFAANDPVNEFLNKDYSQIMEAMDNKKHYRP